MGSSAAPVGSSSVVIASPIEITHLLGKGMRPSTPSQGKNGVMGVREAHGSGEGWRAGDQRIDLLRADDGDRG